MRISIDMKPESQRGKDFVKNSGNKRLINSQSCSLHVPVYLHYYTAYPNPQTGIIETWPDRYEYDPPMTKALRAYQ